MQINPFEIIFILFLIYMCTFKFFLQIDYLETISLLENRIFPTISGIATCYWIDESNKWLPVKAIRETGQRNVTARVLNVCGKNCLA